MTAKSSSIARNLRKCAFVVVVRELIELSRGTSYSHTHRVGDINAHVVLCGCERTDLDRITLICAPRFAAFDSRDCGGADCLFEATQHMLLRGVHELAVLIEHRLGRRKNSKRHCGTRALSAAGQHIDYILLVPHSNAVDSDNLASDLDASSLCWTMLRRTIADDEAVAINLHTEPRCSLVQHHLRLSCLLRSRPNDGRGYGATTVGCDGCIELDVTLPRLFLQCVLHHRIPSQGLLQSRL